LDGIKFFKYDSALNTLLSGGLGMSTFRAFHDLSLEKKLVVDIQVNREYFE